MACFRISFVDGQSVEYHGVSQLTYVSIYEKKNITVSTQLEEHPVPIGSPFWLRTADGIVGISGEGVRLIEVTTD